MKILIYLGCFFAASFFIQCLKIQGITLGAIPTVLLCLAALWGARYLSALWIEHREKKDRESIEEECHDTGRN